MVCGAWATTEAFLNLHGKRNPPSPGVHAHPHALSDNCSPSANHYKGNLMLCSIGLVTGLALLLVACGGGGGGNAGPPPPATYTVGGTVTGLTGSGLVLQNGG